MSAYRDRPLACPRCQRELRRDDSRDVWSCQRCAGFLVGIGELITELLVVAPSLLPDSAVRTISTLGRRTSAPLLSCPTCGAAMEPVFLGGVDLDRCYHDEQLWFDRGEPDRVFAQACKQEDDPELPRSFGALIRRWFGKSSGR
ncbi:MAG: zf-TFIIB domain-containing protein [Deltaproteobacteria bacterium]|nr:zf-TFIIB domain-containing protein [Deltaproteobacteria bacterium]